MKTIIFLLVIFSQSAFGYCAVSVSCESDLIQENIDALDEVNDKFQNTKDKLDEVKEKYDKINSELDKNIVALKIILNEEILVSEYLDKILFEAKRESSIKTTFKGKKK
jgi:hypothetical protein